MLPVIKRILGSIVLAALLFTMAMGPAHAAAGGPAAKAREMETDTQLSYEYEPNVIIIQFKARAGFAGKEKQYDDEVAKVLGTGFELIGQDTYLVKMEELSKNPNAVLNRFKNNQFIEYVEPNYLGSLELAPTDPNYKVYGSGYARLINAEAGWDYATTSSVLVGLIDSGYSGSTDLPAASGYNVLAKSADLNDKAGHGTQVAGTLGARANNGDKNVGVLWEGNILPVKITESTSVTVANVASAITYAVDKGARVLNLSLSFTSDSSTLKNAINYAYNKGCVIVAATGNNGKASVNYPAAYSNVLGVGGSANGTARYSASNYGNGLDVLASYSWYSTTTKNNNTLSSGTSISAPQVAGLAALVWELAPGLGNAQVMQLIRDNTTRGDGKWEAQTGYGMIDMGATLAAAGGVAPEEEEPEPAPGSAPAEDVAEASSLAEEPVVSEPAPEEPAPPAAEPQYVTKRDKLNLSGSIGKKQGIASHSLTASGAGDIDVSISFGGKKNIVAATLADAAGTVVASGEGSSAYSIQAKGVGAGAYTLTLEEKSGANNVSYTAEVLMPEVTYEVIGEEMVPLGSLEETGGGSTLAMVVLTLMMLAVAGVFLLLHRRAGAAKKEE